ncbi:hypothetical protein EW146_g6734, partial [Bondarzewia mesenterica]
MGRWRQRGDDGEDEGMTARMRTTRTASMTTAAKVVSTIAINIFQPTRRNGGIDIHERRPHYSLHCAMPTLATQPVHLVPSHCRHSLLQFDIPASPIPPSNASGPKHTGFVKVASDGLSGSCGARDVDEETKTARMMRPGRRRRGNDDEDDQDANDRDVEDTQRRWHTVSPQVSPPPRLCHFVAGVLHHTHFHLFGTCSLRSFQRIDPLPIPTTSTSPSALCRLRAPWYARQCERGPVGSTEAMDVDQERIPVGVGAER